MGCGWCFTGPKKGLKVIRGDLNRGLPFKDESFDCIFGLSVLEHLINGCHFLKEANSLLTPGGHLILVTPNLSAWFNISSQPSIRRAGVLQRYAAALSPDGYIINADRQRRAQPSRAGSHRLWFAGGCQ